MRGGIWLVGKGWGLALGGGAARGDLTHWGVLLSPVGVGSLSWTTISTALLKEL